MLNYAPPPSPTEHRAVYGNAEHALCVMYN